MPSLFQGHCEGGGTEDHGPCLSFQGPGKGTKVTDSSAFPPCLFMLRNGGKVLVTISIRSWLGLSGRQDGWKAYIIADGHPLHLGRKRNKGGGEVLGALTGHLTLPGVSLLTGQREGSVSQHWGHCKDRQSSACYKPGDPRNTNTTQGTELLLQLLENVGVGDRSREP